MQNLTRLALKNNLPVILDFIPGHYSVSMKVWVRSGSCAETAVQNGLAHFLEHMAFKGTKTRTAQQIAEEFDELGGSFNACTSKSYTIYYVRVLSEHLEKGMEILSDIVLNSIFDEVEMEKEKKVVLEEIAQTEDSPDDIIFDRYFQKVYPDQPIGRPILGSAENVLSFTRDDLDGFIGEHYHTGNVTLIASGTFNTDAFLSFAERYFGGMKTAVSSQPESEPEVIYNPAVYSEDRKLEQSHIILGFPSVGYCDSIRSVYTAKLLSIVLGGSMSSRLFQEVREQRGLAYCITAFDAPSKKSGLLAVYSSTEHKNVGELVRVTLGEMARFSSTVEEVELERAKKQIKSSLLMSLESSEARASYIGRTIQNFGDYMEPDKLVAILDGITVKDISLMMEKILFGKKVSAAVIGTVSHFPEYDELVGML